ncbi:Uncharacterized conserved protein, circularly permuted ATPgrasp superfamily [Arboricoccus pini]|uniref:Uncharacterized conserved protein, circularly permuted ATPgrasp superfamily n=1 Tax=Arboricoccus pini TaxID=1963835 RepID=A0A212PZ50_9PROT|nr:circularly permuted type 2 ATP-grasp protein [Arboricoccus pini]SNB52336.1 Uncharacterized conserved protein, circularly permuted ATPgrasp superfamily [Arboricoccus pini]
MSFSPANEALSAAAGQPGLDADLGAVLEGYAAERGGYDEMVDARGQIRPHWRAFLDGFATLGADGRQAALDSTSRHVRESGIAFNVYADPDDRRHTWRLDLAPLLLTDGEWARISAGLRQRARLMEAALGDLYGPKRLLTEGILPARPFLGAAEFVHAEAGLANHRFLHTYACDIARTRAGNWVVLGDQTDTDIGAGYVIASRVALSHGMPGLFRATHARRLAGFYRAMQEALQAQLRKDDGRIAVLSPGPEDPCYFSHAYLARYLGYTLTEAADLTVRDGHLYLKTLDGLQRIDLLLRRVGGAGIDPLFTTGRSGVAGLMQAIRSEGVIVANGPGAALMQNRALAPWSEAAARLLLDEDLLLGDAPCHWLGTEEALEQAMAEWPDLRLMPLRGRNDPGAPVGTIDPRSLSRQEHQSLVRSLAMDGWSNVAVPPVDLATAPSFENGRLQPRPFAIRCYLTRIGDDWNVLPGGLVRMAGAPAAPALPNGFGSKDLWITGSVPEMHQLSLLRASIGAVHLRRTGADLLSRTADNLFWLGRYAERAEGRMRVLRSLLSRVLEDRHDEAEPALAERLLAPPDVDGEAPPVVDPTADIASQAGKALLVGPYALKASLDHLHRTATLVRDQISHDAWRILSGLWLERGWRDEKRPVLSRATLELLDGGIRSLNAFAGTEAENMTRNFAWRFLELGRRIERAAEMALLIKRLTRHGQPALEEGDHALRLLLELGDSFMTYRSRYLMTPLLIPVLDLLVLDETNPRSIAYQLVQIEAHLAALPSEGPHRTAEHRMILKILTGLRLVEVGELARQGADRRRPVLDGLVDGLLVDLPALSDLVMHSHFAHAEMPVSILAMSMQGRSLPAAGA